MKFLALLALLNATNGWGVDQYNSYGNNYYINDNDYYIYYGDNCFVTETEVIREIRMLKNKCELVKPLKLKSRIKNYPLMSDISLRVNYWEAVFQREVRTEIFYRISYHNICNGKTTRTGVKKYVENYPKKFVLDNPNLDDDIDKSYLTAAMTNKEAEEAFVELKKECQRYIID